jgi:hypothetical protein
LLAAALVATVGDPGAAQDAKATDAKATPEKPPKAAVSDPAKLTDDLNFAIQGEYLGKRVGVKGGDPLGAQVVALGDGKCEVKLFPGGLPAPAGTARPRPQGKAPASATART